MPRFEARINPEILKWARVRAGMDLNDLSNKLRLDQAKLEAWEDGSARPTFEQARKAALALRVPFGFLFFSRPPAETDPLPDLRTVGDHYVRPSLDLRDVVRHARRKQDWLRAHRRREGWENIGLVGACNRNDKPTEIADCLRSHLRWTVATRSATTSWEDYMRRLVGLAEQAGIIVYRSATVGSNTHRTIDVHDFRGFAIVDNLAPLIFVNTRDAPPARIFTLVHELAHLALGIGGVSNSPVADEGAPPLREEERLCNAAAAEFLVPAAEFRSHWSHGGDPHHNISMLARRFRVSKLVVARRALDLGLIPPKVFWPFARALLKQAEDKREEQAKSDTGPPPLVLARSRNGERFTQLVVGAARSGELLYRDAAEILGVRPKHIDALAEAV